MAYLICILCGVVGWVACLIWCVWRWAPYECDGEIVMYEDMMYLAISDKDKKELENEWRSFAKLKLVRKNFHGFNGTE